MVYVLFLPLNIGIIMYIFIADIFYFLISSIITFTPNRRNIPGIVDTKKVSIVIPNWNGRELLEECLPFVVKASNKYCEDNEIIVVDNGSSDNSVEYIRRWFPQIKVIGCDKNFGFAGGCNLGAMNSRNDIVVMLNNDMKVEEDFLFPLVELFAKGENIFAVSSQIFLWDKDKKRVETGMTKGMFENGNFIIVHEIPRNESEGRPVLYAGGGSSAYHKKRFLDLGGFDEVYSPFYLEDTDLSFRAWKRGWISFCEPRSIVHHYHRGTIGRYYSDQHIEMVLKRNVSLFIYKNVFSWKILLEHFALSPLYIHRSKMKFKEIIRLFYMLTGRIFMIVKKRLFERSQCTFSEIEVLSALEYPFYYDDYYSQRKHFNKNSSLNILFLCPYFPYPPNHGGAMIIYNVIKEMSKRNNIYLLSFVDGSNELENLDGIKKYCRDISTVYRYPTIPSLISLNPYYFKSAFESKTMRDKLLNILSSQKIDILHVEYAQMMDYVVESKNVVTVLTEIDVAFLSLLRRVKVVNTMIKKLYYFIEYLKTIRYEVKMCEKYDAIMTLSKSDGDYLKTFVKNDHIYDNIHTLIDTSYYKNNGPSRNRRGLLFVGYFLHDPNVDAVLYFYTSIYPLIKKAVPDIYFTVVGKGAPQEIVRLRSDPTVRMMGYVDDVRQYLWSHSVFVAPLRIGAGIRVKILEALASDIPVISTTIGCEGLNLEDRKNVLIADTPREFARSTIELLKDERLRYSIAAEGKAHVEKHYHPERVCGNLERVYRDLLTQKRSGHIHS